MGMTSAADAAKALLSAPKGSPTKAMSASAEPTIRQAAMRKFWARMCAIYGHRWTSAYGESAEDSTGKPTVAGDTWRRGLSGVEESQLGAGLESCIVSADPWPPTLPEFRARCLGIPPLSLVLDELNGGSRERDPFSQMVWARIDGFRYRHADMETCDKLIRIAYEATREDVMRGLPIDPPAVAAIERQVPEPPKPADPEVARANLARMAEILAELDAKAAAASADKPAAP